MNADGTIKHHENYTGKKPEHKPTATSQNSKNDVKENYRHKRKIHDFSLFKRYHKCDCKNCWKNFGLTTVFYAIVIYLIYLIVKFIFSLIDKQPVKTLTTPTISTTASDIL